MRYTLFERKDLAPRHNETIKRLNDISPTMCSAKWKQVTIHLQNGHTHSCHHPQTHKVSVEEITENPAALHDSKYKIEQRIKMLNGERPDECDYCWRVEDNGSGALSDRVYKSAEPWGFDDLDDVTKFDVTMPSNPTYVEVSWSNVCNLKCSYCGPMFSSKWMSEIENHGPYPTSGRFGNVDSLKETNSMPIPNRDHNPYVEAFWAWWPEMSPKLQHLRVTGGEPLMSQHTFRLLQDIIDNPRPDLELSINSNMCVPDAIINKFVILAKEVIQKGAVKRLKVFTSNEAHGFKADYIRHGMDYGKWLSNLDDLLDKCPDLGITVMSTFNALSVTSYVDFLQDMLELRIKHLGRSSIPTHAPLLLDFPYLRYPRHQAAYILSDDFTSYLDGIDEWMTDHIVQPHNPKVGYHGFHQWEADKLKRVTDLVRSEFSQSPDAGRAVTERADFYRFVNEHDARRATDFLAAFPEMKKFYDLCESLALGGSAPVDL